MFSSWWSYLKPTSSTSVCEEERGRRSTPGMKTGVGRSQECRNWHKGWRWRFYWRESRRKMKGRRLFTRLSHHVRMLRLPLIGLWILLSTSPRLVVVEAKVQPPTFTASCRTLYTPDRLGGTLSLWIITWKKTLLSPKWEPRVVVVVVVVSVVVMMGECLSPWCVCWCVTPQHEEATQNHIVKSLTNTRNLINDRPRVFLVSWIARGKESRGGRMN